MNDPALDRFNRPVPRYTSYPTAPEWTDLSSSTYAERLHTLGQTGLPLSLYLHIPFCKTMCLYCACSVVLNRRPEREEAYVSTLCQEIRLVQQALGSKMPVRQLHFGGGTPTQIAPALFDQIFTELNAGFDIDTQGEIAIEIDPRTVNAGRLHHLYQLGFNRVSFGVQDTDSKVQEAIRRRQSREMTVETVALARQAGFNAINVDLIYGLPYQTQATFERTAADIIALRPDRIALFSYAKVPWLKEHQRAIPDATLPSTSEKFAIYCQARAQFLAAGYVAIGMDHFCLPHDALAKAYFAKTLQRNFQGYSLRLSDDLIGLGMTATGFVRDTYIQNDKDLVSYTEAVAAGVLPIKRGRMLSPNDLERRWVIERLMCDFELDPVQFEGRFNLPFWPRFDNERRALKQLEAEGLVEMATDRLRVTSQGTLFIRNIASVFDAYLQPHQERFSRGI